jgi:hypothetical protein
MSNPRPTKSWQPGECGNPNGRPIGNRNKLAESFLAWLHEDWQQGANRQFLAELRADWQQHKTEALEAFRAANPAAYVKLMTYVEVNYYTGIVRILPREMHVRSENMFVGMSDEELGNVLGEVRRQLAARAGIGGGAGSEAPSSSDQLN